MLLIIRSDYIIRLISMLHSELTSFTLSSFRFFLLLHFHLVIKYITHRLLLFVALIMIISIIVIITYLFTFNMPWLCSSNHYFWLLLLFVNIKVALSIGLLCFFHKHNILSIIIFVVYIYHLRWMWFWSIEKIILLFVVGLCC